MKDNFSINISDPKAAAAFLDACFPKRKYTPAQIERAKEEIKMLGKCGISNAVRRGELTVIIESAK